MVYMQTLPNVGKVERLFLIRTLGFKYKHFRSFITITRRIKVPIRMKCIDNKHRRLKIHKNPIYSHNRRNQRLLQRDLMTANDTLNRK